MHSTPDGSKQSRLEYYQGGSIFASLPDSDPFIINAFHQLGLASSNGIGVTPISWQELSALNEMARLELSSWESEALIAMSRDYVNWNIKGKEKNCLSPWDDTSEEAMERQREFIVQKQLALKDKQAE